MNFEKSSVWMMTIDSIPGRKFHETGCNHTLVEIPRIGQPVDSRASRRGTEVPDNANFGGKADCDSNGHTPGLEVEVRDILATHARFDDDNVELDLVEAQRLTTAC